MAARKAVAQELTKAIILDAARELFYQKGYQQVSMRQIARELGYSHGAIYYHFKNKAELFSALVAQDFAHLDQRLAAILAEEGVEPRQKLENILLGFIHFGLTQKSHYEIMFMVKDEEVKSYLEQAPNDSYQRFAEALQALGGMRVTPQIAWSIFLSLHGFVAHYIYTEQSYHDMEYLAKTHVQFILRGLFG